MREFHTFLRISYIVSIQCACRNGGDFIANSINDKKLFGRAKIYSSVEEKDLNPALIGKILADVLPIHKNNATQIAYLRKQFKGEQDIYSKVKDVRPEINNTVVENHIDHIVSFKKTYGWGYPLQLIQAINEADETPTDSKGNEDTISKELNILNTYMRNNSKANKDMDLAEELLVAGVGVRIITSNSKDNLKPFELHNLEPENAFVVYNNGLGKKPLFSVHIVIQKDYTTNKENLLLTVFTNKNKYTYKLPYENYTKSLDTIEIPEYVSSKPIEEVNPLGAIPIIEYQLNKNRISLVERFLGAQNALNQLTSSEIDDVEQFVQAMMVFMNAEIDEATLSMAKELGAINIKSNGTLQGDVKLLTSKLAHTEAKVLYDRILQTMLTNAGVPLVNSQGGGGGSTGIARLTDNGWLMADTKAREDEHAYVESEQPLLELVIKLLKEQKRIKELDISNITTKFTRNKSDNLLTKVQALQSLVGIVHPDIAYEAVDLFSDSNEAVARSKAYFGDDFFKQAQKTTAQETNSVKPSEIEDETNLLDEA